MVTIQYFAYGSNMLTERLRARCLSAKAQGVASADNYVLAFCKKSRDGSGKATLCPAARGQVFGVVFDLDESELPKLDEAEGAGNGYDRIEDFQVHMAGSRAPRSVVIYIANSVFIDQSLKPYDWYVKLVVAGARQQGLPLQCTDEIEAMQSIADPKPDRKSRLAALRLLGETLNDAAR